MSKTSSLHKPEVFAVHSYETGNNLHNVHFGRNFNNPKNMKSFKKWRDAFVFAKKKTYTLQSGKQLVVAQPAFSNKFFVFEFPNSSSNEGKRISPDFDTFTQANEFAKKRIKGMKKK